MKLTRRLILHARMPGGAFYRYDVLLGDEVVGTVTTTINKKVKPWSETVTYQANGQTFHSLSEFKAEISKGRTSDV